MATKPWRLALFVRSPPACEENKTTPESRYPSGVEEAKVPSRNGHAHNVPPEDKGVKFDQYIRAIRARTIDPSVPPSAVKVYWVLAGLAAWRMHICIGYEKICKHTGLTKPTVIKAIKKLEDAGWILVDRRKDRHGTYWSYTNVYRILTLKESKNLTNPKRKSVCKYAESDDYRPPRRVVKTFYPVLSRILTPEECRARGDALRNEFLPGK